MNIVVSLLILLLSACSLVGCGNAQSTSAQAAGGGMPATLVKTAAVTSKVLPETSTFVGMLKSRRSVSLRPQVAGRVTRIFVRSGDDVSEGTALLELDKSKQEAVVSNASASIESSLAEQENAKAMLKSLESTKLSRETTLKFAKRQFERYKTLADEGAVSTENVDQWRNQLNIAQADVETVEAQIRAQQATLAKTSKLLKQAKAAMSEQQEQLRYFTVRAPFAGEIGDIPVRIGDYVTSDTLLTTVDQTRPLELYISVPTTESRKLHKGLAVQILNDDGTVHHTGSVFFVGAQVDSKDQSVLLKAEITNPSSEIRSGQQVNARVIWGSAPSLTVPVTAVTRLSGQDFVFIASKSGDGKLSAMQKAVKLAAIDGNEYRVLSGLQAGEEIVVSGTQNLSDGMPIKTGS